MLYTVLRDPKYSCYAGYLWAPFDTLLNVPRLQLFDQDRVWYHIGKIELEKLLWAETSGMERLPYFGYP